MHYNTDKCRSGEIRGGAFRIHPIIPSTQHSPPNVQLIFCSWILCPAYVFVNILFKARHEECKVADPCGRAVYECCIFRPAFWVCSIFNIFCAKKLKKFKKVKKFLQNFAKKCFFKFAPKRWSSVFSTKF